MPVAQFRGIGEVHAANGVRVILTISDLVLGSRSNEERGHIGSYIVVHICFR